VTTTPYRNWYGGLGGYAKAERPDPPAVDPARPKSEGTAPVIYWLGPDGFWIATKDGWERLA